MLEKYTQNKDMLAEILQLALKIRNLPKVFYKKRCPEKLLKIQGYMKQTSRGVKKF